MLTVRRLVYFHNSVLCNALTPTCLFLCLCTAQITELCHEIEDRDDALAKAREAAHKAQLQKYQARPAPCIKSQILKKQ